MRFGHGGSIAVASGESITLSEEAKQQALTILWAWDQERDQAEDVLQQLLLIVLSDPSISEYFQQDRLSHKASKEVGRGLSPPVYC